MKSLRQLINEPNKKSLNMSDPYPYTQEEIDDKVPINVIGNYALGYIAINGEFIVR